MKTTLPQQIFLLCLLFFTANILYAQAPVFVSATPNSTTIARYDKVEVNLNLTAGYTNPYDYSDIAVQAIFTAPDNRKDTVDGFFMQDYTADANGNLTPVGTGSFKVRYSPNETGTWSYVISCTNLSGSAAMPAQTFTCQSSTAPGFVRKNVTNYLSFDNGSQYVPIGENMGWQDNNPITDYTNWMTKLVDNGGNFIRVWMSSWAFALEWKNGSNNFSGLKKYKQSSGFYLDWLLDYCSQKNVYMMLTLNNHGQVSTNVNPEWADNPYNAANGGPAANTWNFFTDATARSTLKNRLRYIVARYGYSKNLQSWELFNEVDWTDKYDSVKSNVTSWHNEMSAYIKSKDVYKHLVTTSFAHDYNDSATWQLPYIDFTQTHYYVSSPNIESVLSAGAQNYLSTYHKPTLNGEFGLGPDGATLSTQDPNGVHIHNAIWGSTFGGGMGSGMTWWWDSYIDPKNLYSHYKPLSALVSKINFTGENYNKVSATTTGGGASDVLITPGANFGAATASSFTIDANGTMTPGADKLGQYLFGSVYNTQYHTPPTFSVNYPVAAQFKVVTGSETGTSPQINISVDGTSVLSQNAAVNSTYTVNIAAGSHTIKVDNLGTDWITISNYTFTNIGSPLSTYVLKSANNLKVAGYALNSKYNWQYLNTNGGTAPAAVTGSSITIPGVQNGTYSVQLYNCSTGDPVSQSNIAVTNGSLTIAMPSIAGDIAFTAAELSTLSITSFSFTGERMKDKNYLYMNITASENVKTIYMERSSDAIHFSTLKAISDTWSKIEGKHQFIDNTPSKGGNYYRLKITDRDGKEGYSQVVKIMNNLVAFGLYPNPFTNYINLHIDQGKFSIKITDQNGRAVKSLLLNTVNEEDVKIELNSIAKGIYYISVSDKNGNLVGYEKIVK